MLLAPPGLRTIPSPSLVAAGTRGAQEALELRAPLSYSSARGDGYGRVGGGGAGYSVGEPHYQLGCRLESQRGGGSGDLLGEFCDLTPPTLAEAVC